MMTASEPSMSEAKCSASAASAWLLVSRAVRCSARARQKFTAISISSTMKGMVEITGAGTPSRSRPKALDQDAAGQNIEQGGDPERGEALELAVAVMMLVIGGAGRKPAPPPR